MTSIALIGYRGVGKSTIANRLAAALGRDAVDADALLEEKTGRTIREIFDQEGEGRFREIESQILSELLARRDDPILALGGGVVLRPENRRLLGQATCVWLQADAETIHRRLGQDPTTGSRRPALTGRDGFTEITQLLSQREPLYRSIASHIVETGGKTPDQIAREIVSLLRPDT